MPVRVFEMGIDCASELDVLVLVVAVVVGFLYEHCTSCRMQAEHLGRDSSH
jgi:hypothetical protein